MPAVVGGRVWDRSQNSVSKGIDQPARLRTDEVVNTGNRERGKTGKRSRKRSRRD